MPPCGGPRTSCGTGSTAPGSTWRQRQAHHCRRRNSEPRERPCRKAAGRQRLTQSPGLTHATATARKPRRVANGRQDQPPDLGDPVGCTQPRLRSSAASQHPDRSRMRAPDPGAPRSRPANTLSSRDERARPVAVQNRSFCVARPPRIALATCARIGRRRPAHHGNCPAATHRLLCQSARGARACRLFTRKLRRVRGLIPHLISDNRVVTRRIVDTRIA
jgi:hypothetical protein